MGSTLVIKVKYGDSLRRFNVCVDENDQLNLDVAGLRAKILSLFTFPSESNFTLRYVDEDGDLVTIVNDDDLQEVMRQKIKFLRIYVHISNENGVKSSASSLGNATPFGSPPAKNLSTSGNPIVTDVLKSLREPLHEALSNLSLDLASKAASFSPVLATLADYISKMGQSLLNSDCKHKVAAHQSSKNGAPEYPAVMTIIPEERVPQSPCVVSTSNANQHVEDKNVTKDVAAPIAPVDLNPPCDPSPSQFSNVNTAPVSSAVPDGDGKEGKMDTNVEGGIFSVSTCDAAVDNSSTLVTAMGYSPFVERPYSGTYLIDSTAQSLRNHCIHPLKRSYSHNEAMSGMLHKGIYCDGCGVHVISGPSFKSKVKQNYNLCSICFNRLGNDTDYIRTDLPVCDHSPQSFRGVFENPPCISSPTLPQFFRKGVTLKQVRPKLDSQFIFDVNVIDGTLMAPSTPFTKIWRMCNNGTIVWPKGTQLVWIGGDKFSDFHSVNLEISAYGVPVEKEIDIAVDFRAPQLPGQYISYWRLASPTGQKFGQRVWVLIQVDACFKPSFYDSSEDVNLNIPLDGSGSKVPGVIDNNVQPLLNNAFLQSCNSNASTEPEKQMVNVQPGQELENNFPINETTFIGHGAFPPKTSVASTSVSCPIIDFSETAPAVSLNLQVSAADVPSSFLGTDRNCHLEEKLLEEHVDMGFKQFGLNREVLRMNPYTLKQSLDDRFGCSEWDPIIGRVKRDGFWRRQNE